MPMEFYPIRRWKASFNDAGDNSLRYGGAYRHSYILFGELTPPPPSEQGDWRIDWVSLDLVDDNGQVVYWQIPNDIDLPVSDSPYKLLKFLGTGNIQSTPLLLSNLFFPTFWHCYLYK